MYKRQVVDYLSQNTPAPYNPEFVWGKEICNRLRKEGCKIQAYNIMVQFGTTVQAVYKPYKDSVLVDKGKNIYDAIRDIEIVKIAYPNGTLAAAGWLAKTNYVGKMCIRDRHTSIVIDLIRPMRETDQSYLKNFTSMHKYKDLLVEPVPINRWASKAVENTLPGIFTGLLLTCYDPEIQDVYKRQHLDFIYKNSIISIFYFPV